MRTGRRATPARPTDQTRQARAFAYESARPDVVELVPATTRRALDLGCSSGAVGEALKERAPVEVVGIEIDPQYAQAATARLDRVINADVEEVVAQGSLEATFGRFDCVIAADVLEHLRDPWTVLRETAALLEPGGIAIVSLPNVRHWETFWQVARHGRWPRRPAGVHDATHLQWFTLLDAVDLLERADLEVTDVRRRYRLRAEGDSRWDRRTAALERTPLRPFFVFQYLLVGRR